MILAAAALVSGLLTEVAVKRDDGTPISHAFVVFTDATGTSAQAETDARGHARVPFHAIRVRASADGCTSNETRAAAPVITIALSCAPPLIGAVRVATGSTQALHALPVAAAALNGRQIAAIAALTSDELIRNLPGLDRDRSNSQFTNYGQLRVSFTGAGTDRGLVLADGIPAQDGFGGQVDWAAYPAEDLVRLELLRGAGSALYGAGAVGGVLSLATFGPQTQDGHLSVSSGSHGFSRFYSRASAPLWQKMTASLSLASQTMSYSDLPAAFASSIDSPAQARSSMASLRLRYAASPGTTVAYGHRSAWDYQQEGRPNYDFARHLEQNDIAVTHLTPSAVLKLSYFARAAGVTNRADQFPTSPGTLRYTQYVPASENGLAGSWSVASSRSTFDARAEGRFIRGAATQFDSSGALASSVAGTQTLGGLAFQETWNGERAEFVAGVRGDVESVGSGLTNRAISPRVALRYDLSKRLAVRLSDGAGLRPPFLNELIRSFQIGQVHYLANAALVPERSSSFSAGLDWEAPSASRVAFDTIHTIVKNAIGFRTVDTTHQIRANFSQAQTDGQTLTYTRPGQCGSFSLSETTQYARVTQGPLAAIGKRLPYVPQAAATASLDTSVGHTQAGVALSYLGQTYADDLNTQPLGTAVVGAVHAGFQLKDGLRLRFEAGNIFSARYLSSVDRYGPPPLISVGIEVPIGDNNQPAPCAKK